ncbi:cupredoxin domain-containing protein [Paraglaciecola agarilytica]|uniref:cupredoxin domain-containing protein n=1 Tax=Paraglaciecola chathamensis TaxID=368405 RepID=UPI001C08FD9E|nr:MULTISPECIES: cupredoxin domain-containing protein [Paraglaciecola]MBU3019574.1 cupredoxin domain-containing protein [Paraglaciecola agarilytica]MDO6557644.1 cupredoxin domain-containing protein [Paraglaciecola chathamensis]MDO6840929.1 cupredoxin domain-containing protein [Paraglaciecola chathamensis]
MLYVNVLGIALIAAIVWWFWLYKPQQVESNNNQVSIVVNHGVYQPSDIKVKAGEKVNLRFDRQDSAPCAEMVIFPQLDISQELSMGTNNQLELPALDRGEYDFHCQMKMYTGKLIAE